ncbi:MAG: hypothetical protein MK083_01560 [Dehalococcoidia bacterium]|nr:hypothetical protein [Dehalococcoidia bacterium]|tara:strand:+ start:44 stop:319 length:276 start_codon:yes stop_codon:yes gene_type:complete
MDQILEAIFTNISLRTWTISATIIFTIFYYFIFILIIKLYSSEKEKRNGIHIIIKITIFVISLIGAILTQGVLADLYFFKDWECGLTSTCI